MKRAGLDTGSPFQAALTAHWLASRQKLARRLPSAGNNHRSVSIHTAASSKAN